MHAVLSSFSNSAAHSDKSQRWLSIGGATRALLALTLGYAMFAFGGVEASSQFVLTLMASVLLLLAAGCWYGDRSIELAPRWITVLLGLWGLLAVLQLAPLPKSFVELLSPARLEQYEPVWEGDVVPEWIPLSASPPATWHALRLLFLAAAVLVATTACVRTIRHVESLLAIVFVLGCLQGTLAVTQIVTGVDKLYGIVDPGEQGMMTAGSFVNHSHFAQVMNLSIGAGIGLLLMRRHPAYSQRSTSSAAFVSGSHLWILAGIIFSTFAVCLSLSRAGMVSLAVALGLVGVGLAWGRYPGRKVGMILPTVAGVFVLLLVFGLEGVAGRLATLGQVGSYHDRWELTKASFAAGADYPLLGAGLGTFALVFPAYDTTGSASVAAYADNEYAQVWVEGGLVGVVLLLAFGGMTFRTLATCLRNHRSPAAQAGWGLMVALVAVGLQSATDFGQRLPGVFLVSTALLGILVALSRAVQKSKRGDSMQASVPSRGGLAWVAPFSAGAALMSMIVWTMASAYAAYQAERWWATCLEHEAKLQAAEWQGSDEDFTHLLVAAENRAAWAPGDATALYELNRYRLLAVLRSDRLVRPPDVASEEHSFLERLANNLTEVRSLAPCYPAPYLLEGQLRSYLLSETERGGKLIARAVELAPGYPAVLVPHGEWLAFQGQMDRARQALHQAVAINGDYFAQAADLLVRVVDDVPSAVALAGDDYARLSMLANMLEKSDAPEEYVAEVHAELGRIELQLAHCGEATPTQLVNLGERVARRGDLEAAIGYYRQALTQRFQFTRARLGLVEALRAQGKYDDALREAKTCLRHSPNCVQAKEQVESLVLEASLSADGPR